MKSEEIKKMNDWASKREGRKWEVVKVEGTELEYIVVWNNSPITVGSFDVDKIDKLIEEGDYWEINSLKRLIEWKKTHNKYGLESAEENYKKELERLEEIR